MKTYTVLVNDAGEKAWYHNDKLHREDGPAMEYASGNKYWYRDGKLHREDGPAIEYANGNKAWYRDDKPHREDGPAVEYANGNKYWYINGEELSEAEWKKLAKPNCVGRIVEIDGRKYRLVEA